jgi:glycosyltransferase involved in cell wall biosynthesis
VPAAAPVVLSVGRFVPFKGYAHLLAAAALVREQRPDVHFILVGDGELRAELEAQARGLALEASVHFTGWRDDVPELLALADVFVLPSLGEHFGRVLIEAMAMEKAVVATDGGGVPEVVTAGESGVLVPPAQPAALARAVVALLRDPGWSARLAVAARRRVEAEFDRSRHAAAVARLYGELAPAMPAKA